METITIETQALGDRSYIVTDGTLAAVVDPQRDIDRVLEIVRRRGLEVVHVLETHVHNDYVSGGRQLARATGATYVLHADEELFFDFHGVRDGDELVVGELTVRAVHTPGHTPTHLAYHVVHGDEEVVFTGGSLLYGSVGRTDLVARARAEELTRAQHASVRRLADSLDAATLVYPTHGFGSFCTSASSDRETSFVDEERDLELSTIGQQREVNLALTITDEDEFVETLLSGLDAYPRYYAHMSARNRVGPAGIDLTPPVEADPSVLSARIHAGEWVVDLRSRTAFAGDHVLGTINVEGGEQFSTYLAWLLPWGTPVTLVGDTPDEVAEAQRQLVRVGIDRPASQATGGVEAYGADIDRGTYRVADFGELVTALGAGEDVRVLDVRRDDERADGGIAGSLHIPLHELQDRVDEVPADAEVWVHCASGYRAALAASLLHRAGRAPVLIDDLADRMDEHDLDIERPAA
jgi:hydroxyacylglutathione hydrolase